MVQEVTKQIARRRKQKRINNLEKDIQRVKEELQRALSVLGFSYICSLFLVDNDKSVLHHDNIQKQILQNFLKISSNNVFSDSHNPERAIFDFSPYELTDEEKSLIFQLNLYSLHTQNFYYLLSNYPAI